MKKSIDILFGSDDSTLCHITNYNMIKLILTYRKNY
jgi:hypothetical protein